MRAAAGAAGRRSGPRGTGRLLVVVLAVAPAAGPALAAENPRVAVGAMLGEPSGVSLRIIDPRRDARAYEFGAGWSRAGTNGVQAHGMYQWHLHWFARRGRAAGSFYLGAGGRVKSADGTRFGVRGAAGVNCVFPRDSGRWEWFVEAAPILDLTPDRHRFLNGVAGVRFYPGAR